MLIGVAPARPTLFADKPPCDQRWLPPGTAAGSCPAVRP